MKKLPKEPSLLSDVLSADDWSVITQYVELLKPLKDATMLLQGHVNTTGKGAKAVRGAIWQVLPIFDSIMTTFETARQRHLPVDTLNSQRSQQPTLNRLLLCHHSPHRRLHPYAPQGALRGYLYLGSLRLQIALLAKMSL
jgi:hypothetical protein